MRLIDADLLKSEVRNAVPLNMDSVYALINNQPTVNEWIPCSERLPEEPKPNPLFENKPLEFYMVTEKGTTYPFRAFWNGKAFTDGWSKLDVIAWQPLPQPYQESELQ